MKLFPGWVLLSAPRPARGGAPRRRTGGRSSCPRGAERRICRNTSQRRTPSHRPEQRGAVFRQLRAQLADPAAQALAHLLVLEVEVPRQHDAVVVVLLLHPHEHIDARGEAQGVVQLHAYVLLVQDGHEVGEAADVQLVGLGHEGRAVQLRHGRARLVHGVVEVVDPVLVRVVGRGVKGGQGLRDLVKGEVEVHDVRHILQRALHLGEILRRRLVGEVNALLPAGAQGRGPGGVSRDRLEIARQLRLLLPDLLGPVLLDIGFALLPRGIGLLYALFGVFYLPVDDGVDLAYHLRRRGDAVTDALDVRPLGAVPGGRGGGAARQQQAEYHRRSCDSFHIPPRYV